MNLKNWDKKRFKFVASMTYGDSLPSDNRLTGNVNVFGSNGMVGTHSIPNTRSPAIIVGRKGSYGKVNWSDQRCFAIDTTYYIDNRNSESNLRWLYYLLLSMKLDSQAQLSTVPGLDRNAAGQVLVLAPPLETQRSIATYLDRKTSAIDDLIAKKSRMIALLEEKRSALINHVVTKGLDRNVAMKDSGVEWIDKIPQGWRSTRLKHVTKKIIDCKNRTPEYSENGEFGVVRTSNIRNGKFRSKQFYHTNKENYDEWTYKGIPEHGDVLFTREAPMGEACLVPKSPKICLGQRTMLFKTDETILTGKFIIHSIYSGVVKQFIDSLGAGSTVSHLRVEQVFNLPMIVPPIGEQHAIIEKISRHQTPLDSAHSKLFSSIQKLREYRQALITAAVTGQIDCSKDPLSDDPHEVTEPLKNTVTQGSLL